MTKFTTTISAKGAKKQHVIMYVFLFSFVTNVVFYFYVLFYYNNNAYPLGEEGIILLQ